MLWAKRKLRPKNTYFIWEFVYEGAYEEGLKQNSYVDLLNDTFGNNYFRAVSIPVMIYKCPPM